MDDPPLPSTGHSGGFFFLWSALTQQIAAGLVQKLRSDLPVWPDQMSSSVFKWSIACEPVTTEACITEGSLTSEEDRGLE